MNGPPTTIAVGIMEISSRVAERKYQSSSAPPPIMPVHRPDGTRNNRPITSNAIAPPVLYCGLREGSGREIGSFISSAIGSQALRVAGFLLDLMRNLSRTVGSVRFGWKADIERLACLRARRRRQLESEVADREAILLQVSACNDLLLETGFLDQLVYVSKIRR